MKNTQFFSMILLAVLMSLATPVVADFQLKNASAHVAFDNNYIVGSGTEVYDGTFGKVLLTANFSNGVFAEFWAGRRMETDPGWHELDYTVGWSKAFDDWSLAFAVDWYDIGELGFSDTTGDILHPKVGFRRDFDGWNLFGQVEWFHVVDQSENSGLFTYVGVGKTLSSGPWSTSGEVRGGYDGSFNADTLFARIDLTPSYRLSNDTSVDFLGLKLIAGKGHKPTKTFTIFNISHNF